MFVTEVKNKTIFCNYSLESNSHLGNEILELFSNIIPISKYIYSWVRTGRISSIRVILPFIAKSNANTVEDCTCNGTFNWEFYATVRALLKNMPAPFQQSKCAFNFHSS